MIGRAWLALAAAGLLAGCPGPAAPSLDAGLDAGVEPPGPVELCERLAAARCALQRRCWPAFTRLDPPRCVDQEKSTCLAQTEALRPAFEEGRLSVDAAQLAACERRMTSSACPPSLPPDSPAAGVARPFDDCGLGSGVLSGRVAVGETCDEVVECISGARCVKPRGTCRGTCVALALRGEPCGVGCGPGLSCQGGACAAPAPLDAACERSADCEPELICTGTCRPRRKLGEACRFDPDRLSPCEPGLACDVTPFVAGALGVCVTPRAPFAPCRFHTSCQPGLVCADLDWSGFPTAAPPPGACREPDGADFNCPSTPWARYVGDQCAPGLTCRAGENRCQALPRRGEACTPSRQDCAGFEVYCKPTGSGDVGTCTGPAALGDTCAFRLDSTRSLTIPCAQGFCERDVTMQCRPAAKTTGSVCAEDGECVSGRCVPQTDGTLRCAPAC